MPKQDKVGGWLFENGRAGGWQPEPGDYRDIPFRDAKPKLRIGDSVSLREEDLPPIRDQGRLGSCTGHGARGCAMYKLRQKGEAFRKPGYDLSPLYAYYRAREEENSIYEDAGAYVRDVVKMAFKWGIATEQTYPYDINRFTRAPSEKANITARWHQLKGTYRRCATIDDIIQSLANDLPVVGGFSWFSNSDYGPDGHIPPPDGRMEGGHCVWFIGADTRARELRFQNSWSERWGDKGYGYLPFQFVENGWADDFWSVEHE